MIVSRRPVSFFALTLIAFSTRVRSSEGQACSVCKDGSPITAPEKQFGIEGLPVSDCAGLSATAPVLTAGTALCESVQSVGTLCGCPIPQGACTLCYDGSRVTEPRKKLDGLFASDYVFGAPEGALLDCESLEAVLHQQSVGSDDCLANQWTSSEQCGCPAPPDDQLGNFTGMPERQNQTKAPAAPCALCTDGGPVLWPERKLQGGDYLPVQNCSDLQRFVGLLTDGSEQCNAVHYISTYCGCTAALQECAFCSDGTPVPYPDKQLSWLDDYLFDVPHFFRSFPLTCSIFEAQLQNVPDNQFGISHGLLCMSAQFKSGICGCEYSWKPKLVVWAYRTSGMLSLVGSFSILVHVLSSRKRRQGTYHQLVLGISSFDILSSLMYVLATVMMPQDTGLYQAVGTDVTCKMQGFFLQLGLASVSYNVLLSLYFLLVVNYNWKEQSFKRIRWWLQLVVIFIGLALAFAGIPFYDAQLAVCYVVQPPVAKNYIPITMFYTVPIAIALVVMIGNTVAICRRVYTQQKKSKKWAAKKNMNLSRKVFWQSLWFVLSFFVTLPFLLITYYLVDYMGDNMFWLFVLTGFVAPAQGLLNAFVYFNRDHKLTFFAVLFSKICKCRRPVVQQAASNEQGEVAHARIDTVDDSMMTPTESGANIRRPSEGLPSFKPATSSFVDAGESTIGHYSGTSGTSDDEYAGVNEFMRMTEDDHAGPVSQFVNFGRSGVGLVTGLSERSSTAHEILAHLSFRRKKSSEPPAALTTLHEVAPTNNEDPN